MDKVDDILGGLNRLHMFLPNGYEESCASDLVWDFAYHDPYPDELRDTVENLVEYFQDTSDATEDATHDSILIAALTLWINDRWRRYVASGKFSMYVGEMQDQDIANVAALPIVFTPILRNQE